MLCNFKNLNIGHCECAEHMHQNVLLSVLQTLNIMLLSLILHMIPPQAEDALWPTNFLNKYIQYIQVESWVKVGNRVVEAKEISIQLKTKTTAAK